MKKAKKRRASAAERLKATAYHEAGHAVAHCALHLPTVSVSIEPSEDYLGVVKGKDFPKWFSPELDWSRRIVDAIERTIVTLLAGYAAEKCYCPKAAEPAGASADDRGAVELLFLLEPSGGKLLQSRHGYLLARAEQLVRGARHEKAIHAVAAALLERRTLSGVAVARLWRESDPHPQPPMPRLKVKMDFHVVKAVVDGDVFRGMDQIRRHMEGLCSEPFERGLVVAALLRAALRRVHLDDLPTEVECRDAGRGVQGLEQAFFKSLGREPT